MVETKLTVFELMALSMPLPTVSWCDVSTRAVCVITYARAKHGPKPVIRGYVDTEPANGGFNPRLSGSYPHLSRLVGNEDSHIWFGFDRPDNTSMACKLNSLFI